MTDQGSRNLSNASSQLRSYAYNETPSQSCMATPLRHMQTFLEIFKQPVKLTVSHRPLLELIS